ncbi:hypothetical protein AB0K18_43095 [Nonomuraea sp. NPDC049421]|uniref:hypothetical protein n=1 Tax=Nonomuraea sp. NPDC049421 TaxID=3155275 RepID=UPI0034476C32
MTTPAPAPALDHTFVDRLLDRIALHVISEQINGETSCEAVLRDLLRMVRLHQEPDVRLGPLFTWAEEEAARRVRDQRTQHPHGIYG